MTTQPGSYEPASTTHVLDPNADSDHSADEHIQPRPRARPKEAYLRGAALIPRIFRLEKALRKERDTTQRLSSDLAVARRFDARSLNDGQGLHEVPCASFEAEIPCDTWTTAGASARQSAQDPVDTPRRTALALHDLSDLCRRYRTERDGARAQLARMELALRRAQAAQTSIGQRLTTANAVIAHAQRRLADLSEMPRPPPPPDEVLQAGRAWRAQTRAAQASAAGVNCDQYSASLLAGGPPSLEDIRLYVEGAPRATERRSHQRARLLQIISGALFGDGSD